MLNNHCGSINRGSATKLTNLQDQSKPSNTQINTIQTASLNNGNNHDNISPDNSESAPSVNNTSSAVMDEKQKMLLLKIANNSIAAASAVASAADNDYGNVSGPFFRSSTSPGVSRHTQHCTVHFESSGTKANYIYPNPVFIISQTELCQFQPVKSTDVNAEARILGYV